MTGLPSIFTRNRLPIKAFVISFIACCATVGCNLPRSGFSMTDSRYFGTPPQVWQANGYSYLVFRYPDAPCFFALTSSRVVADRVVFRLAATSSSGNMEGRLQAEEIKTPHKLQCIATGQVYWQEPDGSLLPIAIVANADSAVFRLGVVRGVH